MDMSPSYPCLATSLERQELESGGTCSPQVYGQLLAIYLLVNDLPNAKLLWKRIPPNLKEETPELKAIWSIGRRLSERKVSEIYATLRTYEWPGYVKNIMASLMKQTRERMVNLVAQSYSYISSEELVRVAGLESPEEVANLVESLGWSVDSASGFVVPLKSDLILEKEEREKEKEKDSDSSQEQLQKLAEYVAFLENY